jgi:Holliday junction resolvase RusA-like endonuclease
MMEPVLTFQVRGKPRGKARPRVTQHGTYTPAETVAYEAAIKLRALAMASTKTSGWPALRHCDATFEIPKSWSKTDKVLALQDKLRPIGKPDFDNIGKIVGDALKGVIWKDDSAVVDGRVLKWYGPIPFLQVEVFDESRQRRPDQEADAGAADLKAARQDVDEIVLGERIYELFMTTPYMRQEGRLENVMRPKFLGAKIRSSSYLKGNQFTLMFHGDIVGGGQL